jgi:hypothetical protein
VNVIAITLVGIVVSACALFVLARRDPMRLRVISARVPAQQSPPTPTLGTTRRRAFAAVALAPGPVLLASSGWAPFVIWAGSLLVCGWVLAGALNCGRGYSSG